ncbi:MAG: hypothetical protein NC043_02865 [Muribaculaceae bacterium]|nr:hypothetical protein [Muribaculaceae bacterium]
MMMRLLIIAVAAAMALPAWTDSRRRTTRRALHTSAPASKPAIAGADTIVHPQGWIKVSGYDKPLRSSRESALFTNTASRTIISVTIGIHYTDMQGRELHARTVELPCSIPPDATRQLYWPSWDRQLTFYYHLSPRPRRASATPYRITCTVDTLIAYDSPAE